MTDAKEVIQQARKAAQIRYWRSRPYSAAIEGAGDAAVGVLLQELRDRISPGEEHCTCNHLKPTTLENIYPFHTSECGRWQLMVGDFDELVELIDELLEALDA